MYDALRATLVQGELVLLRVLKFELKVALALDYLPRYLQRVIGEVGHGAGDWASLEEYDRLGRDDKAEYNVVSLTDTGLGTACKAKVMQW